MKLYNNAFFVTITLFSFCGALCITTEECEKMPAFFEQEIDEHQKLEDKRQKLEDEKASLGYFAVFTQSDRMNDIENQQNNIENQQLCIHSRLRHELDAGCLCSDEIFMKMVALYAKIDDKNKKTNR